jgi:hypothetical protein
MKLGRLLVLALLVGPALPAADPAAVAAALAQPVDAGRYPQAEAVVLLDERVVTLDDRGRAATEGHLLVKILQERALGELGDQQIPFLGDAQSCEVLVARTHLPSGRILEPEATGIMEVSDPEAAAAPFYSNARLKVVSFPGLQPGAVMELRYRVKPLPGGAEPEPFMGEMLFGGSMPILECAFTLRVPAHAGLSYQMFNGGPDPAIGTSGQTRTYAWVVRNQPQITAEPGMVPYQDLAPRLVWTVAGDRSQLGRWLYQRFQAAAGADPQVRAQARALTAGLASPEAKVKRLALFVIQEIQNVPLGLGRVGYRPTPAGTILANRCADVRDKVVLFQALLEAVGLAAQPVFVQERRVRLSSLACLPEYQTILARVPLPSGARFYNLSQDQARLGELLPDDAGRPALLAGPAGGRAITTPRADPRRQFVHARWDMTLDARGDLAGRITMAFGGLFDHQLRDLLSGLNQDELGVLFQSIADGIKPGARLGGFRVTGLGDLTTTPVVRLTLRIPAFACRQGGTLILNLPGALVPMGETLAQPLQPAVQHPFLVPASFGMAATLALRLPPGYRIAYRPPASGLRQGPFAYRIASRSESGRLLLTSAITWKDAVVQPSAYPPLWQAFGQAGAPENGLVLLARRNQPPAAGAPPLVRVAHQRVPRPGSRKGKPRPRNLAATRKTVV